ncbi:hypothetical protein GCM10023149_22880 [Mucilaginibacter gynuensis]|uniref:Uncharacterized protein n=1 Tax=Mucilaginibacter gynuensis TaxID=1302236 RepID=A0ABP8GDU9_9SPHI
MSNKQIRPEWVPSAYQEAEKTEQIHRIKNTGILYNGLSAKHPDVENIAIV